VIAIDPQNCPLQEVHQLLIGCVGPRPIALVSTLSKEGLGNLAPFSFFNAFGANPPIVAFSPARRGRDGTLKDTYHNLMATKECVIHAVSYALVEQVNLASTEYEPGVNEFVKSGLTPISSLKVKPKRVKESPFHMECKLNQMIPLGEDKGSGNLAICEVLQFHIAKDLMEEGSVRTEAMDLVGRMGGDYYARAHGNALFQVDKALAEKGMGIDALPDFMRNSHVYSANNLGRFGNTKTIPSKEEVFKWIKEFEPLEATEETFAGFLQAQNYKRMLQAVLFFQKNRHPKTAMFCEMTAKCALENRDVDFAWKIAIYANVLS
jgi:flavin reductase (DIM6/NTAB) family NADH-FMN oxidoreductase RutF